MEQENLSGKEKGKFSSVLKKKEIWISGVIGIIIGGLLIYLLGIIGVPGLGNQTIATMKSGKITENSLYKEMKKYYPVSYVLELIDDKILEKKYELTDEQKKEIDDQVNNYLSTYQSYYGYTEEQFLEENGFETKDEFKDYLTLDYKRNLYYIDYLKTKFSEEEINKYYEENVYGEINTKHMLAAISDDVTDEQALELAKEIIAKLDSGANFDDVAKEYEGKITFEELGYNGFNLNLASEYVEASKALENGTYSKEPVKTDFGYHIIYRIDQKDKPSIEDAKNDIVEVLGKNLEAEDQYIRYKALIQLREESKLKIKDSKFNEEYQKYCKQVNGEQE